jgi:hypothetical protein
MRRKISGLLAAVTLGLAALAAPSAAMADYTDYYWNWNFTTGVFGARHTLSYNVAQAASFQSACVNALNETGTSWVTNTVCGPQPQINFCACALRYPWAGYNPQQLMTAFSGYR